MTSELEVFGGRRHTLVTSTSGIRTNFRFTGGCLGLSVFLVAPNNLAPSSI